MNIDRLVKIVTWLTYIGFTLVGLSILYGILKLLDIIY